MRICLVSRPSISRDPRAMAEAESLRFAGHEVVGVSRDPEDPRWVRVPGTGVIAKLTGRSAEERLRSAAASLQADIYVPTHPSATGIASRAAASRAGASVHVAPTWPRPAKDDLIGMVPSEPWRAKTESGAFPALHVPGYERARSTPLSGDLVVAYRRTDRNPGRYLEAAMERSGLRVHRVESIDWDEIPRSTIAVVVVESPLPALRVRGVNPGVPVVFWVHHGEHHLHANLRLQRRYGAQAVILAHSWHLAYRFTGVVDRLPFAVAPELFSSEFKPHDVRTWDAALVGGSDPDRYPMRAEILDALYKQLGPDRVRAESDVSPEEMSSIYRDARIVVDVSAGRHLPITMRVFEATGAGAALISQSAPGISLLFSPNSEFLPLGTNSSDQILSLLDSGTETIGRSGHKKAWHDHTYDIRVQEIMSIVSRVRDERVEAPEAITLDAGLPRAVDRFVDAQKVLVVGGGLEGRLPGREIWNFETAQDRAEPGTFHVSVIAEADSPTTRPAVYAARNAVIAPEANSALVRQFVAEAHPDAHEVQLEGATAFFFGSVGYRVANGPDPV